MLLLSDDYLLLSSFPIRVHSKEKQFCRFSNLYMSRSMDRNRIPNNTTSWSTTSLVLKMGIFCTQLVLEYMLERCVSNRYIGKKHFFSCLFIILLYQYQYAREWLSGWSLLSMSVPFGLKLCDLIPVILLRSNCWVRFPHYLLSHTSLHGEQESCVVHQRWLITY